VRPARRCAAAIELAAARVNALSVGEIIDRLGADERLLRHHGGSVPARLRTLRATLDWSHQFLPPGGKALLARLSTFQGSFSLLAAEAVGTCQAVGQDYVIDVLCLLVDRSLVQAEERGGEHRYRLLGSVRRYAEQKLIERGEDEAAQEAHARFYLGLAHQALAGLDGPDQAQWLDRLEVEHDSLRAVLGRQLAAGREGGGLLASWLWPFWYRRGYYLEARRWLEMALDGVEKMSRETQAAVLTGSGTLAFLQCEYDIAKDRLHKHG
jgi:predicted ATPase